MPDTTQKLKVRLSAGQRQEFDSVCRRQSVSAAKVRRARALLMSDESHPEGRRRDWEIAESVGLSERQVVRIRQQFVRSGAVVLERQPRPSIPGKLDGAAEAHLITLCCSSAPDGRDHWTLQLLCDELARLKLVESVCPETVRWCLIEKRQGLKKMNSSPGVRNDSVSRKRTAPGSWRGWKMSSTSTRKHTTRGTR